MLNFAEHSHGRVGGSLLVARRAVPPPAGWSIRRRPAAEGLPGRKAESEGLGAGPLDVVAELERRYQTGGTSVTGTRDLDRGSTSACHHLT